MAVAEASVQISFVKSTFHPNSSGSHRSTTLSQLFPVIPSLSIGTLPKRFGIQGSIQALISNPLPIRKHDHFLKKTLELKIPFLTGEAPNFFMHPKKDWVLKYLALNILVHNVFSPTIIFQSNLAKSAELISWNIWVPSLPTFLGLHMYLHALRGMNLLEFPTPHQNF